MDDVKKDCAVPAAAKSIDPAALDMLAHADECGIETAFSRADHMKPCPIGESGACCRICSMGPCRLVGKDAEEKTGICGADMPTIASRHFARQVAGGVAAHSDHGRDMAMTLRAVALGEAAGYKIKDEQKLVAVAGYMDIATAGREVNEIALDVADKALEQFGQPHGEIIYTRRATPKRQALWRELGLTPRAVDREVTEVMHRTHEGVDLDAENILKSAMRCSLADGWGGAMLSTDISDILFGTPSPLSPEVNLGVPKSDQAKPIVRGQEANLAAGGGDAHVARDGRELLFVPDLVAGGLALGHGAQRHGHVAAVVGVCGDSACHLPREVAGGDGRHVGSADAGLLFSVLADQAAGPHGADAAAGAGLADGAGLHGVGAAEGRLDAALVGVRQHLERRRVDTFGGGRCGAVLLHVIHWLSPWAGAGARRTGAGCVRRPSRSATVWVLTEGTGGSGCKVSELSTCGSLPTWPGRRLG